MKIDSRLTGFLLGAGASVPLGYPVVSKLTEEVREQLPPHLQKVYQMLLAESGPLGSPWSPSIESVLAIIDSALQHRLPPRGASLADLAFLGHEVRSRIWSILAEDKGHQRDLAYLDPLADFVEAGPPVVVFSLNNDRVIERWCRRKGLRLVDGFNSRGFLDPSSFKGADGQLTLVKLHGSVDWERTSRGQIRRLGMFVHSPAGRRALRSPLPELTLVFPSEVKVVSERPFFDLFRIFHELLSRLSTLVVIGCGLHDSHVASALKSNLLQRPDFEVLIVDPNPGAPLEALIPTKELVQEAGHRIDVLPLKIGDALAGPLRERLGRGASGPVLLRNVLILGSGQKTSLAFPRLQSEVGSPHANRKPGELSSLVPHLQNAERLPGPWSQVFAWLARVDSGEKREQQLLEAIGKAQNYPVPRAVASAGDQLFVLTEEGLFYCDGDGRPVRQVGPRISGATHLTIAGRYAWVVQTRLFGFEGPGCLRRIDLLTGHAIRLARDGRPLVLSLLRKAHRWLPALVRARSERTRRLRLELYAAGLLRWPTAALSLPDRRLLLVESRRPTVIDLTTHRVDYPLPERFINLEDAAQITPTEVVLLEGGIRGEGRLWMWRRDTNELGVLVEDVFWGTGLAWEPNRRILLVAQSGNAPMRGQVAAIPIDGLGIAGRAQKLASNLFRPKRLLLTPAGQCWCCTGHGLIRIELGAFLP